MKKKISGRWTVIKSIDGPGLGNNERVIVLADYRNDRTISVITEENLEQGDRVKLFLKRI